MQKTSPSPRRAWIEILFLITSLMMVLSPSPRRAWIEILIYGVVVIRL